MHRIPKGFENHKQFILWRAVPKPDGKTDKIPTHPEGFDINAHDVTQWMDAATATAWANHTGLGVAFVFTNQDPFWFIDIDDCAIDGAWSPVALDLIARFPGCAVEVSQSGRGLHLFGAGVVTPDRRCKSSDKTYPFDLYNTGRFVALVGTGLQGDANTDHTPALYALVTQYLTQDIDCGCSWTTEPVAEYTGPEDDQLLIDRMMLSSSPAAVFGGKAPIQSLWSADASLGEFYPHDQGTKPFDHNAADMALCTHLAFWTGKNCERMDRLFRLSALNRDKWETRQKYRAETILKAIGLCRNVYTKKSKEQVGPVVDPATMQGPEFRHGLQWKIPSEQLEHFKGCVYVVNIHRVFTPDGSLLKPEQFKALYGGFNFSMDTVNDKTSKNAWEVFTESQALDFPKAGTTCFRPELDSGSIIVEDGIKMVNTYVPIDTPKKAGDAGPFLDLVAKLLPVEQDRQIILAYMAACVQHIGVKFQWAPLIQGCEGNGKSLLTSCIARAIGRRYTHLPNSADLGNKFNAWILGKLFIGFEEIHVAERRDLIDALKPMITNRRIDIQGKGTDQFTGDNRANIMMNSNHKDAVWKTDRRMAPFYTAQQEPGHLLRDGMGGDYFPNLYAWLRADGYAIVAHYLSNYAIPDALNPATKCQRAPVTSSSPEAAGMSMGSIEQEVVEAIEQGAPGFANGWISSFAFDKLLDDRRANKLIPRNRRRDILKSLGYDWHPGLRDGRVNNPIPMENGKPRLYIKNDHISCGITGTAEIVNAYIKAQGHMGENKILKTG